MHGSKELLASPDTKAHTQPLVELRGLFQQRLNEKRLELPLLPGVAMQVTSAAARDDVDTRVLTEILKRDAALAAHVLRVVNSPVYSPRAQIVSLQQAVARVGSAKIREIALIVACKASVFRVKGYEAEIDQVFRHSIATALFAQEIARHTRNNVEDAFLCGLLHDIGQPVTMQGLLSLADERRLKLDKQACLDSVRELHCSAGAALASAWTLPETAALAIAHHHGAADQHPAAVHITSLADAAAHALLDHPELDRASLVDHPALAVLEIYPDILEKILGNATRIRETTEVMS